MTAAERAAKLRAELERSIEHDEAPIESKATWDAGLLVCRGLLYLGAEIAALREVEQNLADRVEARR